MQHILHHMLTPEGTPVNLLIASQAFIENLFSNNVPAIDTMLISITCPMDAPCAVHESEHLFVFRMEFNDIDRTDDSMYTRFYAPEQTDFDGLKGFVEQHADAKNIFVHCGSGLSRSPAVAWSICDFLHLKDAHGRPFADRAVSRYTPNMRVKRLCDAELGNSNLSERSNLL